ncbi:hypothetical protein [Bacillus sp. JJ722]|uniref:hypothetical protein n=1 Tax=Bacillus sp. JJ722 TaxID=3122973 RepID=UPI003000BA08
MAIHTRGLLECNVDKDAIIKALKGKFKISSIDEENQPLCTVLVFEYGGEEQRLSIFENFKDQGFIGFTKKETVTLVELSLNSNSSAIVQGIVEKYGGYYIENDYGDLWSYIEAV